LRDKIDPIVNAADEDVSFVAARDLDRLIAVVLA
jgi:hypothetical protein